MRLLAVLALAVTHSAIPAAADSGAHQEVLRVSPSGPYTSIAAAVAAARPHQTVVVGPGVYTEGTVTVDRPLTLQGRDGAILDGQGSHGLILITADSVSILGLTLRNTGSSFVEDRAAVRVERARFCHIEGNRIEGAHFGIYLANAADCVIRNNQLTGRAASQTSAGNGIHLWYSTRVTVRENRIRGHRDGIYFEFVQDSRVEGNQSVGNLRYGLHFMFSDRCEYVGNTFLRNEAGVAVMYTKDALMEGNDFDESRGSAAYGLLLKDITDSRIARNRFRRNSVGIFAEGVNRVEVVGNDFVSNGWGVKVMASSERSSFRGNNFVANSFDVSTNSRQARSTFEGNYWDRYRGYDLDRDGSGDVPFRPVRLFSLVVEQNPSALVLQRSMLVSVLDLAEQVLPVLTPANLVDPNPALRPHPTAWTDR